jgi:hypothetical protein
MYTTLAQDSWAHTLADGVIGAMLGSIVSVLVAIYVIQRSQRMERDNQRESLSLAAAERLTEALLVALRRLNGLSDHTVSRSQASRSETLAALVSELQTAVELHAPVLLPKEFGKLPDQARAALEEFSDAIGKREQAVMQAERLNELHEDRAYAVDRQATRLRQVLTGYIRNVIEALTAYRRGDAVTEELLRAPAVPATASVPSGRRPT